jgi:hypothetical protein
MVAPLVPEDGVVVQQATPVRSTCLAHLQLAISSHSALAPIHGSPDG